MPYGTIAGVAALAPRFANKSGAFDNTTRPSDNQVESWLTQVSAMIDSALSNQSFSTPIPSTDVTAYTLCSLFCEQITLAYVEAVNGQGRFRAGSKATEKQSAISIVAQEISDFVAANAAGFSKLGVERDEIASITPITTDLDGIDIEPLFSRNDDWMMFVD